LAFIAEIKRKGNNIPLFGYCEFSGKEMIRKQKTQQPKHNTSSR